MVVSSDGVLYTDDETTLCTIIYYKGMDFLLVLI